MFKNRDPGEALHIAGPQIARLRQVLPGQAPQRTPAERLQLKGVDLGKNAVQQIEAGKRFVTDMELRAFTEALGVDPGILLYGG